MKNVVKVLYNFVTFYEALKRGVKRLDQDV